MHKLTEDIRKEAPWDMMFADDRVLSKQNHREPEKDLEIWRNVLERKGLKVSQRKTEYLKAGVADVEEEMILQGNVVERERKTLNMLAQQLAVMEDVKTKEGSKQVVSDKKEVVSKAMLIA